MRDSSYRTLIDTPTRAFIDRTNAAYPVDATGLDIAGQRQVYDAMCAVFRRPRPKGVVVIDEVQGGVPTRRYEIGPSDATIVYFHGGGFVVGSLDSHDDVCAEACAATGLRVVSVDYRLVPEHLHPAAFDDALSATRSVSATFGPVILAGDSAGGALAASVAHALRGSDVRVLGQVLIYPGLGGNMDAGSYLTHANAPMLTRADVVMGATIRQNGPDDPTALPLCDPDFTGLPPTLAIAAECDPIADDSAAYAAAITAAGGRAVAITEPGLVHGYLRARHRVPRAARSFARICTAITDLSNGHWPPRDLT